MSITFLGYNHGAGHHVHNLLGGCVLSPLTDATFVSVRSRGQWRRWLERNHDKLDHVWLVFFKHHTGEPTLGYGEAVEEALCFGWVDSLVKRLDEDRYARKFTPRRADSKWSSANRKRYDSLQARGLLAPAGIARPPTDRDGDAPTPAPHTLPVYLEQGLKANKKAWDAFRRLTPSQRRAYVGWIDTAKREATRQRRLAEAVARLAAGQPLGMK